ncbi:MAG: hypothetical protein ACRDIL_13290 [Candidatus Limnocylindrales bacterium]
MADLGRARANLDVLVALSSEDSAKDDPGLGAVTAELRDMVDEVLAATSLAIEALPVGPASQPLLEALTSLADACAPVAAALTRPVPDPVEALRWWPAYDAAFMVAARAVAHSNPLLSDGHP